MIIRDGQKWACRSCITGHRSSKCVHEDRELFPVAKKGRPSSQCRACNHGKASHSNLPVDVPCTCQAKRRGGKLGSKSPTETPTAIAATVAPPVPPPVAGNLVSIPEYKKQRYSEDGSGSVYSDGSPAFPAPGWPSSSRYGSFDSMHSRSSCSSVDSSPVSTFASVPSNAAYSYPPSHHIAYSQDGESYPAPSSGYQQAQTEAQPEYMQFHSLQAPQSNHQQWPVDYGTAPPLPPSAAGDSPSTALYKAMGLQGLPAAFSHGLADPSPLLLENNNQGQPGFRQEDFHARGTWSGPDMTTHMRSPDTYHNPYSHIYHEQPRAPQNSSFYTGMSSGNDINSHNRYIPGGARASAPESPGWNATTPSAAAKDSWMQLPAPDLTRPGYPDGPMRWNTAPPNMYSGGPSHNTGGNDHQSSAFQSEEYQQDFPQPPPLTRAAASMPMPDTNDTSRFFERTTVPQVMNLRLPEGKKRKSVDS